MSGMFWVLIFVQLSQAVPVVGSVGVNVQPIYFRTKDACDLVAREFNKGPEPSDQTPREQRRPFGAICRSTAGALN